MTHVLVDVKERLAKRPYWSSTLALDLHHHTFHVGRALGSHICQSECRSSSLTKAKFVDQLRVVKSARNVDDGRWCRDVQGQS